MAENDIETDENKPIENNDEVISKLRELEHKIDSIKKEKLVDSEDQLFFGVIISLFILFVTLSMGDFTSFLQNTFRLSYNDASTLAQSVRYLGIALFLFSALTRYYAVVGNQTASKKYRYYSLEGFVFSLASILVIISVNLITVLASLTQLVAVEITVLLMTLMLLLLNILEIKILNLYASRTFIAKKYAFPFSSFIWLSFIFGICIANAFQLLALLFGVSAEVLQEMYNSSWGIPAIIFGTFYVIRWFKLKPEKDSGYYKLQRSIRMLISKLKDFLRKSK
jgi:hypothetical protein